MNNSEIINKINKFQKTPNLHPLTCADSSHKILVAIEENGKVILKCNDCDYTQSHIPEFILDIDLAYFENILQS